VEEAHRRLMVYGKNRLEEEETSKATILLRQFKNPLVYILAVASMITLLIGEWKDLVVIILIVGVLAYIRFRQYRV
jgi:Ca2+-transporting ATPase